MQIAIDRRGDSQVALVTSDEALIVDGQSALDLIATVGYETGCHKFILAKSLLAEHFFDLRSGLAGEVLQKLINYRITCAIVGDFSGYTSRSLAALMRESNRGTDLCFASTTADALEKLHGQS